MIGLGNKKDPRISKVCLFMEYGPLLKQMYSTSHHSFCFCLYLFFGAMELWNLSEHCLARVVAPDLFARIVNTSRGGLIDTRALIHGHFVRNRHSSEFDPAVVSFLVTSRFEFWENPGLTLQMVRPCTKIQTLQMEDSVFFWHLVPAWHQMELRFKDWSHCWCCNGCCGKRSTILLQDRT